MNLIGNALKFTAEGSVEVTAARGAEEAGAERMTVIFHVTDTGIGIKPENQGRIFALFEQEDCSMTKRFGGVGLGLAISKQLVTQMGGGIWLESVPGVGSRFSFTALFEPAADNGADVAPLVAAPSRPSKANLTAVVGDTLS